MSINIATLVRMAVIIKVTTPPPFFEWYPSPDKGMREMGDRVAFLILHHFRVDHIEGFMSHFEEFFADFGGLSGI